MRMVSHSEGGNPAFWRKHAVPGECVRPRSKIRSMVALLQKPRRTTSISVTEPRGEQSSNRGVKQPRSIRGIELAHRHPWVVYWRDESARGGQSDPAEVNNRVEITPSSVP